jgi:hypothetical protein
MLLGAGAVPWLHGEEHDASRPSLGLCAVFQKAKRQASLPVIRLEDFSPACLLAPSIGSR